MVSTSLLKYWATTSSVSTSVPELSPTPIISRSMGGNSFTSPMPSATVRPRSTLCRTLPAASANI